MMSGALAKSFPEKVTTDSSCNAETLALHSAVKETTSVRKLFKKLGMKLGEPTKVMEDNSSTISIMGLSSNRGRCGHILIKHFFAKNLQAGLWTHFDRKG